MVAAYVTELASVALVATEHDGGSLGWLLALGPAGAGALYFGLWRYYRNADASHSFERETRIEAKPVTGNDMKVNEIKGTRKSGIDGDNHTNHRQRVQRFD